MSTPQSDTGLSVHLQVTDSPAASENAFSLTGRTPVESFGERDRSNGSTSSQPPGLVPSPSPGTPSTSRTNTTAREKALHVPTKLPLSPSGVRAVKTTRTSFESFLNRPLLHIKDNKQFLLVGMVGLPARGKSYIAKKIARYLQWLGYKSKIFNLGQYRRYLVGADAPADFFDPANQEACAQRNEMARMAMQDVISYFRRGGQAAIYDATNTNVERRNMVREMMQQSELNFELIWVESLCNDETIISRTIRDTKQFSPDYQVCHSLFSFGRGTILTGSMNSVSHPISPPLFHIFYLLSIIFSHSLIISFSLQ